MINFEIFPYLSVTERVDLQRIILSPDERVCHGGALLALSEDERRRLKYAIQGKLWVYQFGRARPLMANVDWHTRIVFTSLINQDVNHRVVYSIRALTGLAKRSAEGCACEVCREGGWDAFVMRATHATR